MASYIVTNHITGTTTITPSTEDAVYTKASLFDGLINKPFRWTTKVGCTLLFNFGSAVAKDIVVILGHTFTAAATITLKAGTTSACADYSNALVYEAQNIYEIFPSQSYQYWKLEVEDAGHAAFPGICEMYLGANVAFTKNYSYGGEEGLVHMNDTHTTEFGSDLVYEKYHVRTWRLPWNTISAAERDEIKALVTATKRNLTPFVFIPDITDPECAFVRIVNPYSTVASPAPWFSSGLELKEESPGKEVAA